MSNKLEIFAHYAAIIVGLLAFVTGFPTYVYAWTAGLLLMVKCIEYFQDEYR